VRSLVKAANDNPNDELIGRTRELWRPRVGYDLSRDEAKQIAASVTGFFSVLVEWSRADMPDPANDNVDAATSDDEGPHDDR
jgi:hypothetical protein